MAGQFKAIGGLDGGGGSAVGGPGTVYIHKLPSDETLLDATHPDGVISHDSNVTRELTNRTLFIDNRCLAAKDQSVTTTYSTFSHAASIAWLMPGKLPEFVPSVLGAASSDIVIDYLQMYGCVEVGFLRKDCLTCSIDIRVANIESKYYVIYILHW